LSAAITPRCTGPFAGFTFFEFNVSVGPATVPATGSGAVFDSFGDFAFAAGFAPVVNVVGTFGVAGASPRFTAFFGVGA
jgi:hypothetical protein